jgi:radical SAM superfamily enzyme YgiQ (UPF0313 family)
MRILFIFYDNESRDNILPLGATYVAAYVRKHGFLDIIYYCQDVYHYSEHHLYKYLQKEHFDVAALGFVAGYFQHQKIKKICDVINAVKERPFIVLGGHGPTPVPEYFIRYAGADAVVMGEGELPFLNLVRALADGTCLSQVKGIAYRDGEEIRVNEREKPIKDLDEIPFPYIEPLPMEYYVKSSFLSSPLDRGMTMCANRGCIYQCNFCLRLEKGIRLRSTESIVEEIKKYVRDYGVNLIWFYDELFMINKKRVFEVCEKILQENLKIKYFCAGKLNTVTPEIIQIMRRSGCTAIDYGIEQFDDDALKKMNKKQTTEDIERGIRITLENGIHPLFNIIFGNLGDTRETLQKSLDFLHKYNDYGQIRSIRPVTPYPGSPLYYLAIEKGLLKGPEDFYEKHKNLELLTVNFTDIPDDEFHQLLFEANTEIITKYYDHMKEVQIDYFKKVYSGKDLAFRGLRH